MPASESNSSSSTGSNPHNSAANSPIASRPLSPYGMPTVDHYNIMDSPTQSYTPRYMTRRNEGQNPFYSPDPFERLASNGGTRPSTPSFVYVVTSNFTSQTTSDGVRLSESDIVGFQILAVFARIEDANSYAEHECEEIDAGVRRRRRRRVQGGAVGGQEGEGIRAEAIVHDNGTINWTVEDVGHIEVGQWIVQ